MCYHENGSQVGWELSFVQSGRSLRNVIVLAVVLMCAACSKGTAGKPVDAATSARPIPARVVQVDQKQVRRDVESVGSLFPYEEVTVSSEVEGRVEEVDRGCERNV